MIDQIEAAIVEKLKPKIALPVEAFPSKPEDFKKLPVGNGLVLVSFAGGDFEQSADTDVLSQNGDLQFAITLQIRSLRGHQGAYSHLNDIWKTLNGFSPDEHPGKLSLAGEDLTQLVNGVWVWKQTWLLSTCLVDENDFDDEDSDYQSKGNEILGALKATLTGTGGLAFASTKRINPTSLTTSRFPAAIILPGKESQKMLNNGQAEVDWLLQIKLYAIKTDLFTASANWRETAAMIGKKIAENRQLSGLVIKTEIIGRQPDVEDSQSWASGTLDLTIRYRFNELTQGG